MKSITSILIIWLGLINVVSAQVPDAAPASGGAVTPAQSPVSAPANAKSPASDYSFLGKDVPVFNPGTELLAWDGKHWNINNQRIFQSRFEKYLNAPEETAEEDLQYQQLLHDILKKLAPENYTPKNLIDAWRLLPQASNYTIDSHLCDALADAVYSVWSAKRAQDRLIQANEELERQRSIHEWNARMANEQEPLSAPSNQAAGQKNQPQAGNNSKDLRIAPHLQRLAEVNILIKANTLKREVSEVQARIEFQALIVQFFIQRRFQHVIMATRFYRYLFSDGDTSLKVGKDVQELFAKGTGMPPTVGVIDSLANEAIRDVKEGVDAFRFLLSKDELESATKRLAESFIVGEYMPEIRKLPRDMKRQSLDFTQKSNRLISALDVRDFTLAENLVKEMEAMAKDFDSAQPRAAIETTRTISMMHLAKAKNAAVSGDRVTLENELREATTLWPRNPALAEVSKLIFSQADVQQQAIADLERLLSQHNYRQIFDDKLRFIAATAIYPERREQLKKVLEDMQLVEATIARCTEIAKRGDYAGAWEGAERMSKQFPDDSKLNELRANLTTEAAEFVRSIRTAQQLEQKEQIGSGLAWYLKAQKLYPPSEFAQEGIQRLVQKIIPAS